MQADSDNIISCKNVWKIYGPNADGFFNGLSDEFDPQELAKNVRDQDHIVAAADINFTINRGEIFIIMGLSGSGKSTLLRCLSRLVEPTTGEILLDGQDLLKASPKELVEIRRHKMGMVFQNFGLLPHLTVVENVEFPLCTQGISAVERRERSIRMVELVGLNERQDAYPHELSGGQQQRVGIARSLAVEPDVWFLDEPFSALDPLIRTQMQDEFLKIQQQLNKTIIFVTHDFLEALRLADRICIMKDGHIVQIGTPSDIVLNPNDEYVQKFVADVPLIKILRADSVMGKPIKGKNGRKQISGSSTLETAVELFDEKTEFLDVVDSKGEIVGSLSALQLIRALNHSTNSSRG